MTARKVTLTQDDRDFIAGLPKMQAYWHSRDLHFLMNTMMSGDLHLIAGAPKSGKSTEVLAELVALVEQGFGVWADITELSLDESQDRWVSGRVGLPYDKVRREQWSDLSRDALARVQAARLEYVEKFGNGDSDTDPLRLVHNPIQTPQDVYSNMRECARQGRRIYVLDSFTQLTFSGEPGNMKQVMDDCLSKIKDLAGRLRLIVIVVVQFNRDDRQQTQMFAKPNVSMLMGTSKLEQIMSQGLGVTRVPKTMPVDEFSEKVKLFKAQQLALSDLVQENRTRLHALIHRDKGTAAGVAVDQAYFHGRLVDVLDEPLVQKDPARAFRYWERLPTYQPMQQWTLRSSQRELPLEVAA
jgi:replicative DNA helicase